MTEVLLDTLGNRRVAIRLENGVLDDFLFDPADPDTPRPGAIYRGIVDRPVKGQGGVFLRLPGGNAFLKQAGGLSPGQGILVQVTGYPEPGKAVPVTSRVLFKSKYAIVTPGAPGLNVSKAIKDDETRAGLRILAEEAMAGSDFGLILRSVAEGADEAEVLEDVLEMRTAADSILSEKGQEPALLLDGPDAHHLAWREWGTPEHVETEPGCIFQRGADDQLRALARPEVRLGAEGTAYVEPTRALIAVDVNTGGDMSPAAGLKANLAALREMPRALRLRGLGGQVTVDLAPFSKKDRRTVEQVARSALRSDPIETALLGWTPLGHLEFSRKRERLPLDAALLEELG